MSKNSTIGIIVAVIVVIGGIYLISNKEAVAPSTDTATGVNDEIINQPTGDDTSVPTTSTTPTPTDNVSAAKEIIITATDKGFSPSPVTVKVGDTVVFKNSGPDDIWPASAMHPTHTVYPGSDIKKCGTSGEAGVFYSCRAVSTGKSYSFTFTEKGSWGYHDHLNARHFGKINVK